MQILRESRDIAHIKAELLAFRARLTEIENQLSGTVETRAERKQRRRAQKARREGGASSAPSGSA